MFLLARSLGFLVPIFDLLCILHVMRTGRDKTWLYLILFVPFAGAFIYLVSEILPHVKWEEFFRVNFGFLDFFKTRRLAKLEDLAEFAPTVHNRTAYAAELTHQGRAKEAIPIYLECLTGAMKDDMHLLLELADVQEEAGDWKGLLATQARFRPEDARRMEDRLLRSRALALENTSRGEEAREAYAQLLDRWTGEEIRCRLARLLLTLNREEEATELFRAVQTNARRGNSHYRSVNSYWIQYANAVLKGQEKAAKAEAARSGSGA